MRNPFTASDLPHLGLALAATVLAASVGAAPPMDGFLTRAPRPGVAPAPAPPPSASAANHGVTLTPRFDHSVVKVGAGTPVYLAAEIDVDAVESADRRPLALVVVLDVSGSMRGEQKLHHVVEATQYVVDRLGPRDRVSVVAYDSSGHVVYTPEGRADPEAARRELAKLRPGSGTNMEIGLRMGLERLGGLGEEGSVKRLLLLSDGQANEGVHSIEGLSAITAGARKLGASVSTFGVGADYNEDLMAKLAEAAGGNYYVIDQGAELAEVFRKEFEELGGTFGTKVELTVRPPAGFALDEVFGYPVTRKKGSDGEIVLVTLRDLFQGMNTKVLMRFTPRTAKAGTVEEVGLTLGWSDSRTAKRLDVSARPTLTWSDEDKAVLASADPKVVELAQEIESARVLDQASREYEKGNVQGAKDLLLQQKASNLSVMDSDLGGDAERLEAQNKMFDEAVGRFSAPASSREGKAAVKWSKQGARQSAY